MFPHPTRNVGRNDVSIRQFNPKHGVGQGLDNDPLHFNMFFLRHASSLGCGALIINHVSPNHKLQGVAQ